MAAHLDDQEELENFKYFWRKTGRWIFVLLVLAALGYLGKVIYDGRQKASAQEAAGILIEAVEKARAKDDKAADAAFARLQAEFPQTTAAAQGVMMSAAVDFDKGSYDKAAEKLQWVMEKHQKEPFIHAVAVQRLAVLRLQQQKFDEALKIADTPVAAEFAPLTDEVRGDIYAAQGKAKEALSAYDKALQALPKEAAGRDLLQLKADSLK